jgi:predicted metal-dependent enzyme (double-stranded beta helix superfamily)
MSHIARPQASLAANRRPTDTARHKDNAPEDHMAHTLEAFAAACHDILMADPGPPGRERVCDLLEQALKDENFVAETLGGDDLPERKIIYQDPDLGFCILAHVYKDAKQSPPHDHGPTWAIYGQAAGETLMTDWALVEKATPDKTGTVTHVRDYKLSPGMAKVYNEGDLHSPRRDGPTKLIRFEGVDVTKIKRYPYRAVETATA